MQSSLLATCRARWIRRRGSSGAGKKLRVRVRNRHRNIPAAVVSVFGREPLRQVMRVLGRSRGLAPITAAASAFITARRPCSSSHRITDRRRRRATCPADQAARGSPGSSRLSSSMSAALSDRAVRGDRSTSWSDTTPRDDYRLKPRQGTYPGVTRLAVGLPGVTVCPQRCSPTPRVNWLVQGQNQPR